MLQSPDLSSPDDLDIFGACLVRKDAKTGVGMACRPDGFIVEGEESVPFPDVLAVFHKDRKATSLHFHRIDTNVEHVFQALVRTQAQGVSRVKDELHGAVAGRHNVEGRRIDKKAVAGHFL